MSKEPESVSPLRSDGEEEKRDDGRKIPLGAETEAEATLTEDDGFQMAYAINDTPPWPLCVLLGFQHYLTAFGSTLTLPLVLAGPLCMTGDNVGLSELIGTIFFVSGVATLLQTTLGVRLPIVQGATVSFLAPTFSILSLPEWQCPARVAFTSDDGGNSITTISNNSSRIIDSVTSAFITAASSSTTANTSTTTTVLPPSVVVEMLAIVENGTTYYAELGGEQHRHIWQTRLREIQGAIMLASLCQVVLGFTGIFSLVLRYIGPLVIAPTVALVGLALFDAAAQNSAAMWWIALLTLALVVIFSQCLHNIRVPLPKLVVSCRPSWTCGLTTVRLPLFGMFPVLLAMMISWLFCLVLTVTGALPSDPDGWGYRARTDVRASALADSYWIRVPYPGQWGVPTVSVSGVLGMLAGVLASMVESVGDYYACARLSGAPTPPSHALNRGIGIEGIGCVIAGAFGSGNGTTSYSENVAAIGVTKVASRRVVQTAGMLLLLLGCLGKMGALFVTIPEPVVGGMFLGMFSMITAVGLSNLRYVDMRKPRNMCVLGLALFMGLVIPHWISANKNSINTGVSALDQILEVLLSTSMFVGGFIGFVLDNLLPGTDEERGLTKWSQESYSEVEGGGKGGVEGGKGGRSGAEVYSFPLLRTCIERFPMMGRLPFCPTARNRAPSNVQLEDGSTAAAGERQTLMQELTASSADWPGTGNGSSGGGGDASRYARHIGDKMPDAVV